VRLAPLAQHPKPYADSKQGRRAPDRSDTASRPHAIDPLKPVAPEEDADLGVVPEEDAER
jgi:hypothetical protein